MFTRCRAHCVQTPSASAACCQVFRRNRNHAVQAHFDEFCWSSHRSRAWAPAAPRHRQGLAVARGTPKLGTAPTMSAQAVPAVFGMGEGTLSIDRDAFHGPIRAGVLQRLRAAVPHERQGVIVLQGGEAQPVYSTDGEVLFRQEAYFHYLFGVNEDGCWATIDVRTGSATLYVPRLPESYGVWMGPINGPEYYKAKYAVDAVAFVDELPSQLTAASPTCLHVLSGTNTDSGMAVKPPHFEGIDRFVLETEALLPALNEARVHKTAGEVALLRYVNDAGSRAHVAMMQAARPGMMEYQLESLFRHLTYSHAGCRHQGYTCIAASGPNGAVLHYGHAGAPNDRQLADGDMVLFDMGCEYYRYGSDITCSWPVNGTFTSAQKLVYNAVLAAHSAVLGAMKPGVSWPDMHTLAYRRILDALTAGGLLKGDVEEMIAADVGGLFMPHGLGHLLGIDTHDVGGYGEGLPPRIQRPGYKSLRTARQLEPGMVVTVEPGCYFNPVLLLPAFEDPVHSRFLVRSEIEPLIGSGGVRLEDNVLVTGDGALSLTDVPRTVEDVEAVLAGAPWPRDGSRHGHGNSIAGVPVVPGIKVA